MVAEPSTGDLTHFRSSTRRAFAPAQAPPPTSTQALAPVGWDRSRKVPGSLKQAIDHAYDEWQAEPVGFVSYGCGSIGLHAVDQLRTVFVALHAVTMPDVVGVDLLDGGPPPPAADRCERAADVLLGQLRWWGLALRDGRAARPYVS
ncbi:NAD(P)H-dependent oxidoreductase [Micromonospora sp. C31]|uniref:NADPH-dependent FMN reductase n=1 Tax=Micromonospora sp. C31 TaxID=2824876 RepID=UPI001B39BE03|nr:NAD(P)H-dependent oxidoreductase [Micromonospora sp. C31]MBQ1074877.1 NAD(P)H-dependent oxidoreductase [Micromonospora sp. C31]